MNAIEYFEDWLNDFLNFERTPEKNIFWLDTIDYLCKRFDNPQDACQCIHVAGSKGKGSVSKMIACILDEAGYNTGIYSSPHIIDFRERITKPDGFFSEEIYESAIKELVPGIESIIPANLPAERPLTWFELVTLYAFLCFKKAKLDWAVYEVGMGGRLDSTNIIRPKLCCITPIELEHTEFLGDTIEKIAAEKAGIIKNCTPVIIARQASNSVERVFQEKAFTRHAPCYFVDKMIDHASYFFHEKTKTMRIHLESTIFNRPIETDMKLLGKANVQNAALASIAIKKLYPNIDESIIERGLAKAILPGRFEIINNIPGYKNCPDVILDGAHTYNSINLTLDTLNKIYDNKKVNLLFACAADKDIKDISTLFKYRFNHIFLTKPGDKKKSDINAAEEAFKNAELKYSLNKNYKEAILEAVRKSAEDNAILLITGSFYLLAEVKKLLNV